MDWLKLLNEIFQLCIIPLLGVLTSFVVTWIKKKSAELQQKTDNDLIDKYIALLTDTITTCVIATNQTYVDELKNKNAFTVEEQKKALEMTYQNVMKILSEDAKEILTSAVGDLKEYIMNMIEAQVKINKVVA